MKKLSLASVAAAATKSIIGAKAAQPATVLLPQAVSEIHVSPSEIIPGGTIITDDVAIEAGLDSDALATLETGGHVRMIEVYATAVAAADA